MGVAVVAVATAGILLLSPNYTKPKSINENCLTIQRDAIKLILKPGFTDPANSNYVAHLCFAISNASPITINVIPSDKSGNIIAVPDTPVDVLPSSGSITCTLPYDTKDTSSIPAQYFADAKGDLDNFDFIRLEAIRPAGGAATTIFRVYTVKLNIWKKEVESYKGDSYPCPPYCHTL